MSPRPPISPAQQRLAFDAFWASIRQSIIDDHLTEADKRALGLDAPGAAIVFPPAPAPPPRPQCDCSPPSSSGRASPSIAPE
jgi:hypothetical protein